MFYCAVSVSDNIGMLMLSLQNIMFFSISRIGTQQDELPTGCSPHFEVDRCPQSKLIGGKLCGESEAILLAKERIFDGWMSIVSALYIST